MQYVVNQVKQIAIEAETPEEAQKKVLNGEGVTISSNMGAQPRSQQSKTPQSQTNIQAGLTPQIPPK